MTTTTDITVPLLDLKAQYATIRDEIEPVVMEVIESQWFIGGPNISGFEEECAAYCSTASCGWLCQWFRCDRDCAAGTWCG